MSERRTSMLRRCRTLQQRSTVFAFVGLSLVGSLILSPQTVQAQVGAAQPPVSSVETTPSTTTQVPDTSTTSSTPASTTTSVDPFSTIPVGTLPVTTTTTFPVVSAATTTALPTTTTLVPPIQAVTTAVGAIDPAATTTATPTTPTTPTKPGKTATTVPRSPEQLRAAVATAMRDSGATSRSVSISIDGVAAAVELDAEVARIPASTQKIYVAGAALARLGPDFRFVTQVRSTSPVDANGAIDELVIKASGDPSFSTANVNQLVAAISSAGVRSIRRGITIDSTRFDAKTRVDVWKPKFTPGEVGVLDAFLIDRNRRSDRDTLSDPSLANLRRVRAALTAKGIAVGLFERKGASSSTDIVLGSVSSEPLRVLVNTLLKKSDNTYAEMLTKELGALNGDGSTAGGVASIAAYLRSLGTAAPQTQIDGSGLSLLNRSTTRMQVDYLRKLSTTAYGPVFADALPVACVDGTLKGRLCATKAARVTRAKTGSIDFVVGLAGYGQTATGRRVTFSFLLNDVRSSSRARNAIDRSLAVVSSSLI